MSVITALCHTDDCAVNAGLPYISGDCDCGSDVWAVDVEPEASNTGLHLFMIGTLVLTIIFLVRLRWPA